MQQFSNLDWLLLLAYLATILGFSLRAANSVSTMRDFTVASGRIRTPIVAATVAASFIGGGFSMGITAKGYEVGFVFFPVFLAFSIKTIVEGGLIAPRLRCYEGACTVGDVMGYHYGPLVRIVTGVLSLVFCAGIVGVVGHAAGLLLASFTGLPFQVGAFVCTLVVLVYSAAGGMVSSIVSDSIQFVILAIAVPMIALILFFGDQTSELAISEVRETGLGSMPPLLILGGFIGFFFGEMLVPPYTQRAFVGESTRSVRKGFMTAGFFSVPWIFLLLATGVAMRPILPDAQYDRVLVDSFLMFMPVGLLGLSSAAVLAIIMSTQDSFLNSAATAFANDVYRPLAGRPLSDRDALVAGRWSTVLIGAAGVSFSLILPGLIDALIDLYGLWAPTVILPLLFAIFGIPIRPIAALTAIVAGGVCSALWTWYLNEPWDVPAIVPGMIANQVGLWTMQWMPLGSDAAFLKAEAEDPQWRIRKVA